MEEKIEYLKKFFDEDKENPVVSKALLASMESEKPLPGNIFINLEQNKISTQFRHNLIDLIKIKLLHTSDISNVSRLITQMQFALSIDIVK